MRSLSGSSPLDRLGIGVGRLSGWMALWATAGAAWLRVAATARATVAASRQTGTRGTNQSLPPIPTRPDPSPISAPLPAPGTAIGTEIGSVRVAAYRADDG